MNYSKFINPTVASIKPSGIRKFFDLVSVMPDAISLGVGEPDFVTPWHIRDSAIKAIQKGKTQYTSNMGLIPLREQIASYLKKRFDCSYSSKEIIVTVGASEAIDLTLRTMICKGDEVLVPDPSYVSYCPCIELCGGVAVALPTSMENGFVITKQSILSKVTPRTKAIILPYPNNPTGGIMTESELNEIVQVIIDKDLMVISDEIYAELTYSGKHCSIASLDGMRERTVLISGFSKSFAMTGWRIGYVASVPAMIEQILKIHQYTIMCASTFSQYGAVTALAIGAEDDYSAVLEMKQEYDMRRRYLVKAFNDMGLECYTPQGAFYVFPSVASTGLSGEEFAEKLLRSKKVAVVPGSAFGLGATDHIRCSYATSMKNITVAVKRIAEFVKELRSK